jgi:hypothetical protein
MDLRWSLGAIPKRQPTAFDPGLDTKGSRREPEVKCHVRVSEHWCSCMWFNNMWKCHGSCPRRAPHSNPVLLFSPKKEVDDDERTHMSGGRCRIPLLQE